MSSYFLSELRSLDQLYKKIQFSFVFLYGKPGSGKHHLIREFCANKKTFFFSAREMDTDHQLKLFYQSFVKTCPSPRMPVHVSSWSQAFSALANYSYAHRLVFVLDEIQNLAQHCPEFLPALSHAVEQDFVSGKVFLIASTSSISFAEQVMTEPIHTPFDSITARAHLSSLSFSSCVPALASFSSREQLLLYGITGGLPSRLNLLSPNRDMAENIYSLFFRDHAPLFMEAEQYLHRELRETSTYNYLLEIIAGGCHKLAEIAELASIGTNKCAKYLTVLISHGIIRKEIPCVGENSKKVRYIFDDQTLRFWYQCVFPYMDVIRFGSARDLVYNSIVPNLNTFLLPVFETVCQEYLLRLSETGQAPFSYQTVGSWWTGGTKREPFFRIPLVASGENQVILGCCHCDDSPADIQCLESLQQPLEIFDSQVRYCCIFSISGFSERLQSIARVTTNVWLVDLADITAS